VGDLEEQRRTLDEPKETWANLGLSCQSLPFTQCEVLILVLMKFALSFFL
jgi:hypothetical protein